jgi:hypothetical protein
MNPVRIHRFATLILGLLRELANLRNLTTENRKVASTPLRRRSATNLQTSRRSDKLSVISNTREFTKLRREPVRFAGLQTIPLRAR